jgi:integrase
MAETGIRAGEEVALKAIHVDLVNHFIEVTKSMWRGKPGPLKTKAARRTIPISSLLAADIFKHLAGRTEGYLFQESTGEPWNPDAVREQKLRPILNRLGIPTIDERLLAEIVDRDNRTVAQATRSEKRQASAGLHTFRHTNATAVDSLHVPKGVRRKRLGHSGGDTTEHYTHTFAEDERDAAEKLGNLFGTDWPERAGRAISFPNLSHNKSGIAD